MQRQVIEKGCRPLPSDSGFQEKSRQIHDILKDTPLSEQILLDVGCGNGVHTLDMSSRVKTAIGIDIDEARMRRTQKSRNGLNSNAEFTIADAECLPIRSASCGIVLIFESLEHIEIPENALREAHRVLKDSGLLLISVPNKLHPFDGHYAKIGGVVLPSYSVPFLSWLPSSVRKRFLTVQVRIFTKKEIVSKIRESGFTPLHIEYSGYPRLDRLNNKKLTSFANKILPYFEHNALFKRFGMSIFILAEKIGH